LRNYLLDDQDRRQRPKGDAAAAEAAAAELESTRHSLQELAAEATRARRELIEMRLQRLASATPLAVTVPAAVPPSASYTGASC
jgi:hypothetical protein